MRALMAVCLLAGAAGLISLGACDGGLCSLESWYTQAAAGWLAIGR